MNQNTEQVSQNKGLNEFERAKIYYTKKVADNLLYIANPSNKVEVPYKSGAKLEKMGISKDDYKQSIAQNSRNFCAYSGAPYNNVNDFNLDLEKAIHNYNSSAWIGLSDAAIKLEIGKLANEEPQKANGLRNALREIKNNEPCVEVMFIKHSKDKILRNENNEIIYAKNNQGEYILNAKGEKIPLYETQEKTNSMGETYFERVQEKCEPYVKIEKLYNLEAFSKYLSEQQMDNFVENLKPLNNAHFEKSTNAMIRLEHDKDYPMEKRATSNLVLKDVKDRILNDIDKNNAFSDEQKSAYKNNIDKLFETINDYCTIKNEKYQQIFFENQKQNQTQKQVDQYSTMEF
ncbi:hypothetical protein EC591_01470 [Helicobacter pylori]|nr:hypothetical protein [Helicobacter pylori]RVZ80814.1 hypothetical protein EC591_01470 [Helicobacter pylori]